MRRAGALWPPSHVPWWGERTGWAVRYVFGDYEVDARRGALRHKGIPCPLESHALQVLVYLVQHREQVVPEEELLAQLWPQQYTSRATVRQRLRLVREAVGDSGRRQRVIK